MDTVMAADTIIDILTIITAMDIRMNRMPKNFLGIFIT